MSVRATTGSARGAVLGSCVGSVMYVRLLYGGSPDGGHRADGNGRRTPGGTERTADTGRDGTDGGRRAGWDRTADAGWRGTGEAVEHPDNRFTGLPVGN
ncbi:hypothetical protein TPA0905_38630 [Streptomyces olivaceus]|nr:hypothetical protein TPA0905_38630 [Streptomyces olivaceus]